MERHRGRKLKEKRKRRSSKRSSRNPVLFLAGLIIIALFVYNLYIHFYKNRSVTLSLPSSYSSIIDTTALVLRDEVIYSKRGSVKNDGLKVSVGTPLETTENYSNTTGYDINALESKIKTLEDMLSKYDEYEISRKNLTDEDLEVLIRELDQNNFTNINSWYSENFRDFNLKEDQIYDRLARLKIQHDIITKQGKDIVTLNAGELINGIDYYENVLSYDIVNNIGNDFYFSDSSLEKFPEKKEGYKVVNNLNYILRLSVSNKDLYKSYEIGSPITISIGENTFKGTVKSLSIGKDFTQINAVFNEGFNHIKDVRSLKMSIVNYETNAFEVDKSAILKKEDQNGVYIRDASGVVVFKPIQILSDKKSKYVLDAGQDGFITIKDKEIKTIEPYDELLLNPKAVKEGELLN